MAAQVDFFTTALRTYEVQSYDSDTDTWSTVVAGEAAASFPYTDAAGTTSTYYRVRDDTDGVGLESPWTPKFLGLAVAPETCNLVGYVYYADGTPRYNVPVLIVPNLDQKVQSLRYSVADQIEVRTDTDGYFEQELVRGLVVCVKIPERDFQETVTIPDQASVNIDNLV
jgi:hypothetical protein